MDEIEQQPSTTKLEKKTKQTNNRTKTSTKLRESLPWWVELLFVQIGLPDKWLIKILKTRKNTIDFIQDKKKFMFLIFLFLFTLGYFQPVIKHSNAKLKCQKTAFKFINEMNLYKSENLQKLEMLTVNFCNGGNEIKYLRQAK